MQQQEGQVAPSTSCCDIICVVMYYVALVTINSCPVIGWVIGLYRLCNHDEYLGNQDHQKRTKAHFWLCLNGQIVIYLIIYALYYLLKWWWMALEKGYGLRYEGRDKTFCDKLTGVILLTIFSCGLYLIWLFFEGWWKLGFWGGDLYDDSQKRWYYVVSGFIILTFTTLSLFGIWQFFRGWKKLFKYGCYLGYEKQDRKFWDYFFGYVFLTLTTLVLFLPYKILEVWIRLIVYGYECAYDSGQPRCSATVLGGHLLLTFVLPGLFIVWKFFELWVRLFIHGYELAYNKPDRTPDDIFYGRVYLTIATCCIYLLYWFAVVTHEQLAYAYKLWWKYVKACFSTAYDHNNATTCEKVSAKFKLVAATLGLYLVPLFIEYWIRLGWWSFEQIYDSNWTYWGAFWGQIFLTITTLGLFVPLRVIEFWIRLIIKGLTLGYWKYDRTNCDICLGYLCLTVASCGLFLPYKVIELFFRLEIEAVRHSHRLTYNEHQTYSVLKQIAGRICYTLCTAGLFAVFMIGEYFYRMIENLREPVYSRQYKMGIFQASVVTGGLVTIWWMARSLNPYVRGLGRFLGVSVNGVVYAVLYHYVIVPHVTESQYLLIPLCIVNLPIYFMAVYFSYSEGVRYLATALWHGLILFWWKLNHQCDRGAQWFRLGYARSSNWFSYHWTRFSNWRNQAHANFFNNRWPRVFGEPAREPHHPDYVNVVIREASVSEVAPLRTWEDKIQQRLYSEEALKMQKFNNTTYVITCTIAKLKSDFLSAQMIYPSRSIRFWANRFDQLSELPCYKDLTAIQYKKVFYVKTHLNVDIMPNVEGSNQDYPKTEQYFFMYLSQLSGLQSDITCQVTVRLDKYAHKANYDEIAPVENAV